MATHCWLPWPVRHRSLCPQAVLVFTDPGHFFMALQIIIDVLLSSRY